EFAELTPRGQEAEREVLSRTRSKLTILEPTDDVDWVTKTDLLRELDLGLDFLDAHAAERDLNNLASPSQNIRMSFDMLPKESAQDWEIIADRLDNVHAAVDGYVETLRAGIAAGNTPARRQAPIVAETVRGCRQGAGCVARL